MNDLLTQYSEISVLRTFRSAEKKREEEAWWREVEFRWAMREREQQYERLELVLELVS